MSFNSIVYFLFLIIYTLAVKKFMNVFFEKRRTTAFVSAIIYSLLPISVMIRLLMAERGMPMLESESSEFILVSLPLLFFITLNYEASMLKRIVATLYVLLTLISIGNLVGNLIVNNFIPDDWIVSCTTVCNAISYVILYLSAVLMLKYFKHIRKKAFDFPAFWGLALLVAINMLSLGFLFQEVVPLIIYLYFAIFTWAANVFLVLFLNNSLSLAHENTLKLELDKQEKEYYFAQCQLMQESAEQVKAIRHDIKSHLATLKDFTTSGSMDDIKSYLSGLVSDIEKSEIFSNTGNIAFDSIINYKLRNVKTDNIKLDLGIAVPPQINIEIVDIVTILGNLLDNALEAVVKANEKMIKVDIKYSKGGLFVKIENSFNGEVKNSHTSLKDSTEHGYGLKNVKQSVEKYNGHMKITHTDNIFSVGIFLYVG